MKYQEDFIKDRGIEKTIKGRKFLIREIPGEEMDEITNQYVTVKDDDKLDANLMIRNKILLGKAVVDAPYEIDNKPFREAPEGKRVALLQKLKPRIRGDLITAVLRVNGMSKEEAKNSSSSSSVKSGQQT